VLAAPLLAAIPPPAPPDVDEDPPPESVTVAPPLPQGDGPALGEQDEQTSDMMTVEARFLTANGTAQG